MGQSVSVPHDATRTIYFHSDAIDQWEWDDTIDNLRSIIREAYPSFEDADRWHDREERIVLNNWHAVIVVAEYCGCVSVSIVPDESDDWDGFDGLRAAWCEQVGDRWADLLNRAFGGMVKIGTFSNGESVYQKLPA